MTKKLLKYVHKGKNSCLICEFKNHSKIANYDHTQKSKTSKFDLFNTWSENRKNMIDIIIPKILLLQL